MIAIILIMCILFSDYPEKIGEERESFQLMLAIEAIYSAVIMAILLMGERSYV